MATSPITGSLLGKLTFFTLAMILGPISSYFLVERFYGDSFYAVIMAVVVVHVVLVGYLIAAFSEEPADASTFGSGDSKKAQ